MKKNIIFLKFALFLVSHAIVRGKPTASQIYLDKVLDEVLEEIKNKGRHERKRDSVNMAEVLYYSMRKRPNSTLMINGYTSEKFTNKEMLQRIIPIARSLTANDAKGKVMMVVMKNNERLISLYYGSIFAGVKILMLDPNSTVYELRYFMELDPPYFIFCDHERYDDLQKAIQESTHQPKRVITDDKMSQFVSGQSDDLESFKVSDASPEATAVLLPTSGSTGLPKAALMTNQGLLAQLPSIWSHHTRFPRPTDLAMFLSSAQWMTYTNMLTGSPVYDIPILISSKKTPEHAIELFEKFRPTWVLTPPIVATTIAELVKPHQITSLQTVLLTGAAPNQKTMDILKTKFPKYTNVCNSYGMTEAQGFILIPNNDTPYGSLGKDLNIFDYKLVDDDGNEVITANRNGELYVKAICMIKAYFNNEAAYLECLSDDGWWKTGDVFYRDDNDNFWFVERKKFWFKYLNYHISPEELEKVISQVAGVQDCVVCDSEKGAAAAVIVKPDSDVTREQIHKVVNTQLIEYKQLRGGIAFVKTLPCGHSGKLHRRDCAKLVNELIENGQCF